MTRQVRREVLPVSVLLDEARTLVSEEARAKSVGVIVVGVHDEVFIDREQVVLILAALLRDALHAVPSGGRVAVTGQEIERDLVFAVYAAGRARAASSELGCVAMEAATALGGRVWTAYPDEGNLQLFSLPLYRDHN